MLILSFILIFDLYFHLLSVFLSSAFIVIWSLHHVADVSEQCVNSIQSLSAVSQCPRVIRFGPLDLRERDQRLDPHRGNGVGGQGSIRTSPVCILELNGSKKHHRNVGYIAHIPTVRRLKKINVINKFADECGLLGFGAV
jgi:hypothetical protein